MEKREFIFTYDLMWGNVDAFIIAIGTHVERAPGAWKEFFKLYGPDEERPMFMAEYLGRLLQQEDARLTKEPIPAPVPAPYVSSVPITTPQDFVARTPPRQPGEKKVKVKKHKPGAAPPTAEVAADPLMGEVADTRDLPEASASDWKLNKKTLDVRNLISARKGELHL